MTHVVPPSPGHLEHEFDHMLQRLSRPRVRKGDRLDQLALPPARKPVYLLLPDPEPAERLAQQLEFFGLIAQPLFTTESLMAALTEQTPAAIVLDVDFGGRGCGLSLATQMQQGLESPVPLLFFSLHEADTPTRLAAVRAGARHFSPARWKRPACWKGSRS